LLDFDKLLIQLEVYFIVDHAEANSSSMGSQSISKESDHETPSLAKKKRFLRGGK
jgi:hypothetical protein